MNALISVAISLNAFFGFTQIDPKSIVVIAECIDVDERGVSFPGGMPAFQNWFSEEVLKINPEHWIGTIKGRAQFIVNEEGKVVDVKIVEMNTPEVSNSIVKILEGSPKWHPTTKIAGDHPPQFYKERIELPFEIIVK